MYSNDSLNSSLSNSTQEQELDESKAIRAATLVLMQCFIIPGNALILAAIFTFKKRSVSDVLIGCLALIDLINGLGPVNISIAMYYADTGGFQHTKGINWLCLLYAWASSCLRLTACFVATSMAIDRFAAIVVPLYYRTRVTQKAVCIGLLTLLTISIVTASLPLVIKEISTYTPLCSFDFTSPFAVFIAVLGYLQLLVVVLCYVSVIFCVDAFLSRQTQIRATQLRASIAASRSKQRENTLVESSQYVAIAKSSPQNESTRSNRLLLVDHKNLLDKRFRSQSLIPLQTISNQDIHLHANSNRSFSLTPVTSQRGPLSRILMSTGITRSKNLSVCPEIKLNTDICYVYSEGNGLKRGSGFEIVQESQLETEEEARVQLSLKDFKRNNSTWQHSRRLAIVMGIVVFLFYVSWMPIVIAITLSLKSKQSKKSLHFTAARMTLISSMLNFLVYGCMLKQYRQAYKLVFKRFCTLGENTRRKSEVGALEKGSKIRRHASASHAENEMRRKPNEKRVHFKKAFRNTVAPT